MIYYTSKKLEKITYASSNSVANNTILATTTEENSVSNTSENYSNYISTNKYNKNLQILMYLQNGVAQMVLLLIKIIQIIL